MFSSRGFAAACITGEVHNDSHLRAKVMGGEPQLLFIGPELLLLHPLWREMVRVPVYVKKLVCFAILMKHMHCITQWYICIVYPNNLIQLFNRGDYFRKEFRNLGEIRSLIPSSFGSDSYCHCSH